MTEVEHLATLDEDEYVTTQLRRFMHGGVAVDAWGNPIYYRCPGPVHKHGFDLISCGPNGVHEEGQGDDILVGEDLPGGLASIESGSAAAVGSGTRGK